MSLSATAEDVVASNDFLANSVLRKPENYNNSSGIQASKSIGYADRGDSSHFGSLLHLEDPQGFAGNQTLRQCPCMLPVVSVIRLQGNQLSLGNHPQRTCRLESVELQALILARRNGDFVDGRV